MGIFKDDLIRFYCLGTQRQNQDTLGSDVQQPGSVLGDEVWNEG